MSALRAAWVVFALLSWWVAENHTTASGILLALWTGSAYEAIKRAVIKANTPPPRDG